MDVTPLVSASAMVIQGYGNGSFRVSGHVYAGPIIVLPSKVLEWSAPQNVGELQPEHFVDVCEGESGVDIILLGCGPQMMMPSRVLKDAMRPKGISLEYMDTGAACRTYNVLLADGRNVAAMMYPA